MRATPTQMSPEQKLEYFSSIFSSRATDASLRPADRIKVLEGIVSNMRGLGQEIEQGTRLHEAFETQIAQALRAVPQNAEFRGVRDDLVEILFPGFKATKTRVGVELETPSMQKSNVERLQSYVDAFSTVVDRKNIAVQLRAAVTLKAAEAMEAHAKRITYIPELHTSFTEAFEKCAKMLGDEKVFLATKLFMAANKPTPVAAAPAAAP